MLLAEELALLAIRPDSGRHEMGAREQLNACLAGLLVAELLVDGVVGPGDREDRIVVVADQPPPSSATLAAAAQVVAEKGPKIKAVLSHMSRGLQQHLGATTWDAVVAGLAGAGILGPATDGMRPRYPVVGTGERDAVVARLQAAVADDGPIEPRTALLLSMTGPARLLEVVAPERSARKHARQRIDHALDGSDLEPFGKVVRKLIEEAMAAAAVVAVAATTAG
jgi:hypothetical protein